MDLPFETFSSRIAEASGVTNFGTTLQQRLLLSQVSEPCRGQLFNTSLPWFGEPLLYQFVIAAQVCVRVLCVCILF